MEARINGYKEEEEEFAQEWMTIQLENTKMKPNIPKFMTSKYFH